MAIDMTGYNAKFDSIKDKMQALGSDIQALPRTLTAIDNGMDTISGGTDNLLEFITNNLTSYTNLDNIELKTWAFSYTNLQTLNLTAQKLLNNFDNMFVYSQDLKYGNINVLLDFDGYGGTAPLITSILMNTGRNVNYLESELDIVLEGNATTTKYIQSESAFNFLHCRRLEIGTGFRNITASSYPTYSSRMFVSANIQSLIINEIPYIYFNASPSNFIPFYSSIIDRLYLKDFTKIRTNQFYRATIGKIFLYKSCSLGGSTNDTISSSTKVFVPYDILNYFSLETNWTTFFAKDQSPETRMFVTGTFTLGDTLGIDSGNEFDIEWYSDDDFTNLIGFGGVATATYTGEYFGKLIYK